MFVSFYSFLLKRGIWILVSTEIMVIVGTFLGTVFFRKLVVNKYLLLDY